MVIGVVQTIDFYCEKLDKQISGTIYSQRTRHNAWRGWGAVHMPCWMSILSLRLGFKPTTS